MNDDFSDLSNKVASSISAQKDSIIFQILKENNAPIYDLTELTKQCSLTRQEGINYQVLSYRGKDLLMIFDPEMTFNNGKFKCEVKWKKLY